MGYVVVVDIPSNMGDSPHIFHTELYSGDHYRTRNEALPELEEAKKNPQYVGAWIEFRCNGDCETCAQYVKSSDLCGLVYQDCSSRKGV